MAELKTIITLRRGTTAEWANSSITLQLGEIGLEYLVDGSVKLKAGTGNKAWADLPYVSDDLAASLLPRVEAVEADLEAVHGKIGVAASEGVDATGLYKVIAEALAEAKAYADENDNDTIYNDAELRGRIEEIEKFFAVTDEEQLSAALDTLIEIQKEIAADNAGAEGMLASIGENTAAINKLNGDAATEGSVAKQVADAVAAHDETVANTYATKEYVGVIPTSYTEKDLVSYVDKKAEEVLAAAQGGSSETAASVKQQLDNYKAANDTAVKANTTAITSNTNAITTINEKLINIEAGAEVNIIEAIKVNGTSVEVAADRSVNLSVPTKFSDLLDDSGFADDISALETATATNKTAIEKLAADIGNVANVMNFVGSKDAVPEENSEYAAGDVIIVDNQEYVFDGSAWSAFGDASVNGALISGLETRVKANEDSLLAILHKDTGIYQQAKDYTDLMIEGLPAATATTLGLVKVDDVSIKSVDGVIGIKKVSTDLLTQGSEDFILNGGTATA